MKKGQKKTRASESNTHAIQRHSGKEKKVGCITGVAGSPFLHACRSTVKKTEPKKMKERGQKVLPISKTRIARLMLGYIQKKKKGKYKTHPKTEKNQDIYLNQRPKKKKKSKGGETKPPQFTDNDQKRKRNPTRGGTGGPKEGGIKFSIGKSLPHHLFHIRNIERTEKVRNPKHGKKRGVLHQWFCLSQKPRGFGETGGGEKKRWTAVAGEGVPWLVCAESSGHSCTEGM